MLIFPFKPSNREINTVNSQFYSPPACISQNYRMIELRPKGDDMNLSDNDIEHWLASISTHQNEPEQQTKTANQEGEKWKQIYQGVMKLTKIQATQFDMPISPR